MAYEYIARMYGIRYVPGQKVQVIDYHPPRTAIVCRVAASNAHYVRIRIDGCRHTSFAHPKSLEPAP